MNLKLFSVLGDVLVASDLQSEATYYKDLQSADNYSI